MGWQIRESAAKKGQCTLGLDSKSITDNTVGDRARHFCAYSCSLGPHGDEDMCTCVIDTDYDGQGVTKSYCEDHKYWVDEGNGFKYAAAASPSPPPPPPSPSS